MEVVGRRQAERGQMHLGTGMMKRKGTKKEGREANVCDLNASCRESGLKKGHGWNKGKKNLLQSIRWKENNPNADGKLNNLRPKKTDSTRTEFQIYKSEVRKTTYRTIKKLKADGHFLPNFGKYKTDYQIDHIVSIKQGFELGVPASLLGDIKNIQFLKAHDNRAKWHTNQSMALIRIVKGKYYGIQQ